MLINTLGVAILVLVTSFCGIVMFAFYAQKGCDPLENEQVSNSNQLIPFFVMEILGYPALPGLFISCLFSGALRYITMFKLVPSGVNYVQHHPQRW